MPPELTRRRVLAAAATAGAAGVTYATDNPLHRSTTETVATRHAAAAPAAGDGWFAAFSPDVPEADVTQFVGVQHRADDGDTAEFDVLAVAAGRRSTLFGNGALLGTHGLALRGTGDTTTEAADSGATDALASGVVVPPETLTAETPLARGDLDDPAALHDRVGPGSAFGTERDLALARGLLGHVDADPGSLAAERVTLAGVLYALHTATTTPRHATPEYEGGGESYWWHLDGVTAHAARYRSLDAHPGEDSVGLKVASFVPRPSLLGSPQYEHALAVSYPR